MDNSETELVPSPLPRGSFPAEPSPRVTLCISALESTVEKSEPLALPGSGAPAEGCGAQIPKFCKTHNEAFWGRSHCNERGCPRCYERWAAKEAERASLRVAWGSKYWQDRRGVLLERKNAGSPLDPRWLSKKALLGHFVVSMSAEQGLWVHAWSVEKALAMVYEICRRHRVCGGVVVFHDRRHDDDSPELVPDGYWHFHVVGLHFMATTPGGSDIGPDGRIIIFKHVEDKEYGNYGGLRSGRAISRLIQYQLTHAGLRDGRQSLTYFGLLHFSKVPQEVVQSTYPEALEDDSKTNPEVPAICPVCGSTEIEPCYQLDFTQMPTLTVPTIYEPNDRELVKLQVHPEPEYASSPDLVVQAEQVLEEKFQNLYDNEPEPARRHDLTKERQRERAKLAQRELEFFNLRNPLVELWVWLRNLLENGPVDRENLDCKDRVLLDRAIELNLSTNRLGLTPGGWLYLVHDYDLDDALREVRSIVQTGEPTDGTDWRLIRLLTPAGENPIMTDLGFVFGGS